MILLKLTEGWLWNYQKCLLLGLHIAEILSCVALGSAGPGRRADPHPGANGEKCQYERSPGQ